MNKTYTTGKIYKIYDIEAPEQFYIGSTVYNRISQRIAHHRHTSQDPIKKNYRLYRYINDGIGWDRMKTEIIETFEDEMTINDLHKHEGGYILELKPTLNKNVAGRSPEESRKEYRRKNYDKIRQYNNEKFICSSCGHQYMRKHRAEHERTKYHNNHKVENKI